jgi:DNA invertase Pin-like site-specific DNA recombinase
MNGRLGHRALRHALLLDELLPEPPKPRPTQEPTPDRAAVFQAMLDTGEVRNRAELARALGCSKAWVTRVLGPA